MKYKLLIALLLSATSISAYAEQRWFEIEVLMFKRNVDIRDMKEHLSTQEIILNSDNSANYLPQRNDENCLEEPCLHRTLPVVINSGIAQKNVRYLNSSHFHLTKQRQRLKNHDAFTPVLHMAWRMPVKNQRRAIPIHLFAGKNLALSSQKENESASNSTPSIALDTTQPTDKWEIDGNFKVYLDHYLYIDSQLVVRKEVTEKIITEEQAVELIDSENDVQIASTTDVTTTNEIDYQTVIKETLFDQNRRLRSEEIHYLDHPLMGIIVQIRKIP